LSAIVFFDFFFFFFANTTFFVLVIRSHLHFSPSPLISWTFPLSTYSLFSDFFSVYIRVLFFIPRVYARRGPSHAYPPVSPQIGRAAPGGTAARTPSASPLSPRLVFPFFLIAFLPPWGGRENGNRDGDEVKRAGAPRPLQCCPGDIDQKESRGCFDVWYEFDIFFCLLNRAVYCFVPPE
jgi:hypothetical protein